MYKFRAGRPKKGFILTFNKDIYLILRHSCLNPAVFSAEIRFEYGDSLH